MDSTRIMLRLGSLQLGQRTAWAAYSLPNTTCLAQQTGGHTAYRSTDAADLGRWLAFICHCMNILLLLFFLLLFMIIYICILIIARNFSNSKKEFVSLEILLSERSIMFCCPSLLMLTIWRVSFGQIGQMSSSCPGSGTGRAWNQRLGLEIVSAWVYTLTYNRRKFRSETSDNMDSWKAEVKRVRRERVRRKKMQMRERVGKSRNTVFFQWFVAPEGRKVGSLKRRVRSQLARWEMKNCTPLWREAHFEVKMYKTLEERTTFGSWDVEKVHAVVARSTFWSQNVQSTPFSDHFWKLRCRKSARRCGAKHISKSKCTKHTMFVPLLEVQMSKKCTPLWREAHFEVKSVKKLRVLSLFWR